MSRSAPAPPIIHRGDVWWVEFDPTRGGEIRKTRPAVVLTADSVNRVRRTVVVVPLSTGPTPHPPVIVATASAGADSVAISDQMRAVDKGRLRQRIGQLTPSDMHAVAHNVRLVLAL